MANLTGRSRKAAVLDYLSARQGEWVPGLELMNQYVGGLRAGARIYELRREGYAIETRSSATSDVDEYRLAQFTVTYGGEDVTDQVSAAPVAERVVEVFEPFNKTPSGHVDGSQERRASLGGDLPWIAWHGDSRRGFTAKHKGFSIRITDYTGMNANARPSWVWVTTRPDGSQVSGTSADLISAKHSAIEVTL